MKTIQLDESLYVVVPRKELDAAIGDLAEHVAHDCDYFGQNHAKWYRAVKRMRKLTAAPPLPEQPQGEPDEFWPPLTHWSKDPLVPYAGCTCETCLSPPAGAVTAPAQGDEQDKLALDHTLDQWEITRELRKALDQAVRDADYWKRQARSSGPAGAPAVISADVASAELRTRALAYLAKADTYPHSDRHLPTYGADRDTDYAELKWSVGDAKGSHDEPNGGHDMCGINLNSLDRIVSYFIRKQRHEAAAIIRELLNERKP